MEDDVYILPSGVYNLKNFESFSMDFPALGIRQVFYIIDKEKDLVLIKNEKL